ncbi:MAG TPA: hypothetical protein VFE47_12030 [Tepidisphaeraceae bacterium]|jgi:hypothetical protein|nr:hypothetical protein [Tepidisphaeraceae bacterium]
MEPEPQPQGLLTYADDGTDAGRALESLDRAMTARLAQIIGACLTIFGLILMFLAVIGQASLPGSGPASQPRTVLLVLLAGYFTPGVLMMLFSFGIRRGSKAAIVVILFVSVWTFAVMAATLVAAVLLMLRHFDSNAGVTHCIADVLLMIAVGKLIHHDVRLLWFGGRRGAHASVMANFWDYFSPKWLAEDDRRQRTVVALSWIRAVMGTLVLLVGGVMLGQSLGVGPAMFRPPKPAPARFISRDLFGPDGLPAAERSAAIDAFNRTGWLCPADRPLVDMMLREHGAKFLANVKRPITRAAVDPWVVELYSIPPPPSASVWQSRGTIQLGRDSVFALIAGQLRFAYAGNGGLVFGGRIQTVGTTPRWALGFQENAVNQIDKSLHGKLTQPQATCLFKLYHDDDSRSLLDPILSATRMPDGTLAVRFAENRNSFERVHPANAPARIFWIKPDGELSDHTAEQAPAALAEAARIKTLNRTIGSIAIAAGLLTLLTGLFAIRRASRDRFAGWPIPMMLSAPVSLIFIAALLCLAWIAWRGEFVSRPATAAVAILVIAVPVVCEWVLPGFVLKASAGKMGISRGCSAV